jgi:hypothetical protein
VAAPSHANREFFMSIQMILAPLFVQVLLTMLVAYMLAGNRFRAVKRDEVNGPVSLREANWPDYARKFEYNYQNQFELPVLFYLLTVLAIITRHADLFFVLMAWVFVTLRVLHAFVHVTNNQMRLRGAIFISGAIVLTIMWVVFIVRIMFGLP